MKKGKSFAQNASWWSTEKLLHITFSTCDARLKGNVLIYRNTAAYLITKQAGLEYRLHTSNAIYKGVSANVS